MNRALAIILLCSLVLLLVPDGKTASNTSLYQCVSETESMIYTDNPAQLESCSPITETGAVTSLATSPSIHPPMTPPSETPLMTPLPSEPFVFRPTQYEYATPPNISNISQGTPVQSPSLPNRPQSPESVQCAPLPDRRTRSTLEYNAPSYPKHTPDCSLA